MSQLEKQKAKIMRAESPKDITAIELQSFMSKYGFELSSKNGSHYSYKHEKLDTLVTIPMHSPIKRPYIVLVKQAIEKIEEGS